MDLYKAVQLLESFDKERIKEVEVLRSAQEFFFVLGQCHLMSFVQTNNRASKLSAIQNFQEVLNYSVNKKLETQAKKTLLQIQE